ncbi:MAG TPA: pyridoxamine 5'-phosphate oxidase [Pseudonocardia sp.]|nr:pyridoxamine 5'-phosphate oxidase [Pseudonocardia sp.]
MDRAASEQLAAMRVDYRTEGLDVDDLAGTWHEQLIRWMDEAVAAGVAEPNAMVLATADPEGRPSARTVLCKGLDARGLAFYTNYTSAKSHDIRATRYAAATFPWYLQHRQVTVRGPVQHVSPEESQAYWASRPRGSRLGAWASAQSVVVRDRRTLDDALAAVEARFADEDEVPLPGHWGGWRILPEQVEFWQGRTDRMHDRLRFELSGLDRTWSVHRLAP